MISLFFVWAINDVPRGAIDRWPNGVSTSISSWMVSVRVEGAYLMIGCGLVQREICMMSLLLPPGKPHKLTLESLGDENIVHTLLFLS
jgi:hypothetical protein